MSIRETQTDRHCPTYIGPTYTQRGIKTNGQAYVYTHRYTCIYTDKLIDTHTGRQAEKQIDRQKIFAHIHAYTYTYVHTDRDTTMPI